ncbi:non-specific serine/threonine protein kinase [Entamoeba marina]
MSKPLNGTNSISPLFSKKYPLNPSPTNNTTSVQKKQPVKKMGKVSMMVQSLDQRNENPYKSYQKQVLSSTPKVPNITKSTPVIKQIPSSENKQIPSHPHVHSPTPLSPISPVHNQSILKTPSTNSSRQQTKPIKSTNTSDVVKEEKQFTTTQTIITKQLENQQKQQLTTTPITIDNELQTSNSDELPTIETVSDKAIDETFDNEPPVKRKQLNNKKPKRIRKKSNQKDTPLPLDENINSSTPEQTPIQPPPQIVEKELKFMSSKIPDERSITPLDSVEIHNELHINVTDQSSSNTQKDEKDGEDDEDYERTPIKRKALNLKKSKKKIHKESITDDTPSNKEPKETIQLDVVEEISEPPVKRKQLKPRKTRKQSKENKIDEKPLSDIPNSQTNESIEESQASSEKESQTEVDTSPVKRKPLGGKKQRKKHSPKESIKDSPIEPTKESTSNSDKESTKESTNSSDKESTTKQEPKQQSQLSVSAPQIKVVDVNNKISINESAPSPRERFSDSPRRDSMRSSHNAAASMWVLPSHEPLMNKKEVEDLIPQASPRVTFDKENLNSKKTTPKDESTSSTQEETTPTHKELNKKKPKKTKKHKKEDEGPDPMVTKELIVNTDNEVIKFNIANSIGKGAYGEVFQGMNSDSGEFVAIKQMRVNKKSVRNEVQEEINLLKRLKHNHIVRYIASTQSHGNLYIIMEYMESGSLLNIVKKFNHLNEGLSAKYTHQVLDGLVFIHDQGIVHRDIKAANILVCKDGSVKIADFGVSVQTSDVNKAEGAEDPIGTPNWMAPEVIQMQGTTVKADVWALGCTIIELITGDPPYSDINPTAALYKIVNDDHPPLPPNITPQLKDLLLGSSRDLLQQKWFALNGIKEEKKKEEKKNVAVIKDLTSTTTTSVEQWGDSDFDLNDFDLDDLSAFSQVQTPPKKSDPKPSALSQDAFDDWSNDFGTSLEFKEPAQQTPVHKKIDSVANVGETDDWGDDFAFPSEPEKKPQQVKEDWDDMLVVEPLKQPKKLMNDSDNDWGDDFDGIIKQQSNTEDWDGNFGETQTKRKTLGGRAFVEKTLRKDTVHQFKNAGKTVIVGQSSSGKGVAMALTGESEISESAFGDVANFDFIEDFYDDNNESAKLKDEFYDRMKIIAKIVEKYDKDSLHRLHNQFKELHTLCLNQKFTELPAAMHSVSIFPVLAVLENPEFNNASQLRLTAIQIVNTIMGRNSTVRLNVVLSGCSSVVTYGLNNIKTNEACQNEIVKFIQLVMQDKTNKYQLTQMFIGCGGFSLLHHILSMKYDEKHRTKIDSILDIITDFLKSQRNVKTRIDFCSRNITTLLFMKYKIVDGLILLVCRTFTSKKYDVALRAITILIQIIDAVVRNETQIKFVVCQRIVALDLLGTLTRNMDSSQSSQQTVGHDILFNVCKLCKMLMTDSDKEIPTLLFGAKIVFFIVKVLFKCDSLDNSEPGNKKQLIAMMKTGLISNVTQCLDMLCTSREISSKVCLELSSFPNIFVLLKSYCITSKLNSKIIEDNSFNIILHISRSLTRQQRSCDFIVNSALEFLITYSAGNGLRLHVFSAVRSLYEANKKKGLDVLSEHKNILHTLNIFNRTNFVDGVAATELKEFCNLLADHKELTKKYSETTFVRGTAVLLKQVPCSIIETKKNFAMLLKSLIKANPHPSSIPFHERVLEYLQQTYEDAKKEDKIVICNIVEECIKLAEIKKLSEDKLDSPRRKFPSKSSKSDSRAHRRGVSFGKFGANTLMTKALGKDTSDDSSKSDHSEESITPQKSPRSSLNSPNVPSPRHTANPSVPTKPVCNPLPKTTPSGTLPRQSLNTKPLTSPESQKTTKRGISFFGSKDKKDEKDIKPK